MLSLRTLSSAILVGLVAASILQVALPVRDGAPLTVTGRLGVAIAAAQGRIFVAPTAGETPREAASETSAAERVPQARGKATGLLNQPVAILQGDGYSWLQLPRGTPVQVVSGNDALVQIQQGRSLVTIPRAALVKGATRIN